MERSRLIDRLILTHEQAQPLIKEQMERMEDMEDDEYDTLHMG